jgi:predicted metalloprotease with PDZ domain
MRRLNQLLLFIAVLCSAAFAAPVEYTVTLASANEHLVQVRMRLEGASNQRQVQLPVWNGLYQIRDFVQNVRSVRAFGPRKQVLPIEKLDKSTWRILGAQQGAEVEYEIYLDQPGPFGAQFNSEHAFFNFALLLMYAPDARALPVTIAFAKVPSTWRIATALSRVTTGSKGLLTYSSPNYDRLVDSPVEMSELREASFELQGAVYRVAVHANPADYNLEKIVGDIRKIVAAAVVWMDDQPLTEYVFIYHFPHAPGGGGMEHAYSTAIDISAERLSDDPGYLAQITAHEFLHLWNVKRIRPASLEPIDYTRENYTRALWFSEGVTTTAATLVLIRAGLIDEAGFLGEMEHEIRTLQLRPAHKTQSAEESSLDTWLDKYPPYRLPVRSISYYNKGEVLGFLLDLALRQGSNGSKSLRDLFRWMNQNYARQSRYFKDSEGVREAAEALTASDFRSFFQRYVAGVEELPYDQFLSRVGLKLEHGTRVVPVAGFEAVRNFDSPGVIVTVQEHSEAHKAGLVAGDILLEVDGKQAAADLEDMIAGKRPGETVTLRVSGRKGIREVKIKLGSRQEEDFRIVDADTISALQRAQRAAWLASEPETGQPAAK